MFKNKKKVYKVYKIYKIYKIPQNPIIVMMMLLRNITTQIQIMKDISKKSCKI